MDKFYAPQPAPKSKLGNYRKLSTSAGVHLSPICLGGMSIGDAWTEFGFGEMTKESSFKLLDTYFDLGGNFIDTANLYQGGRSEEWIGEWAEDRGVRDAVFIATKYTNCLKLHDPNARNKVLFSGNNAKSMHISLENSLKSLRTTYIDLFYVHFWDWTTNIPEMMQALHALVMSRKVLYLGISDAPAWIVAKANQYARDHALTQFCIYQGHWNVADRSFERDIIPMARDEGMALAPWDVIMGGKIRSDAEEEKRRVSGEGGRTLTGQWERSETEKKICKALEQVAAEIGAKSITSVAIAYVLHKTTHVFPIIGGRKVEHLVANIEALELSLTPEHLAHIESIIPFEVGFPNNLIGDGSTYNFLHYASGALEQWPLAQPITGSKVTSGGKVSGSADAK